MAENIVRTFATILAWGGALGVAVSLTTYFISRGQDNNKKDEVISLCFVVFGVVVVIVSLGVLAFCAAPGRACP